MNYRYPGPRCVISQGPRGHRWTISADAGDAADAGVEFRIVQKHFKKQCIGTLRSLRRDIFVDFLKDVSQKMIGVGTIFGRGLVKNASQTYRSA